jgi:hypothetical protein
VSTITKKLMGFGAFIGGGHVIRSFYRRRTRNSHYEIWRRRLLVKEDMVLQGMIDRLKKIGRWYGMEIWTKIT